MKKQRPVAIIGSSGHASVVAESLQLLGHVILGLVSNEMTSMMDRFTFLGKDDEFCDRYSPDQVILANGIGMITSDGLRDKLFTKYSNKGYEFLTIIHPSAVISNQAHFEDGVQVMAGAVVQNGTFVGKNAIINTRASLDHHSIAGRSVHIGPGATVCGNVRIGDKSMIGAGSTIIQGVSIGNKVMVGAGAVVVSDVPDKAMVVGIPAKERLS